MIEVGPNLFHASGIQPQNIKAQLLAIAVVRDEMWRLPFFVAYHRWLGVQHFIVIDNRSKDGTADYLQHDRDVTCIIAPGEDKGRHGIDWIEWAVRLAPPERWNAILDADELLVCSALRPGSLRSQVRELSNQGAAIVAAPMVDCYPAQFPFVTKQFEPVPWQRAPYFDAGPYFPWPTSDTTPPSLHSNARERLLWPHWPSMKRLKKIVPRPLRTRHFYEAPPRIIKMPLVRNVPGLTIGSIHKIGGAPRTNNLFSLLHYKFDIDLSAKVQVALRERQHWQGSQDYEAYARIFRRPLGDLRTSVPSLTLDSHDPANHASWVHENRYHSHG